MKAILLVRVSTERQNFDEQEKELYNLAISNGFSPENIVPVCEKESGIKLSEEERSGLNRMKEIISEGEVSAVFAWEISRIARKKKIIFSVVDFLVERKIQLYIKEPFLTLLNPDGSVNEGAETILTLYGQLAESEMRNKLARWRRTRIANSKSGIWNGGASIRFGYSVDEHNHFIIDEEQAGVVRLVFRLYTESMNGFSHLSKELEKRGIILTRNRLSRILGFRGYTGETIRSPYWVKENGKSVKKDGHELRYPAIITPEIFEIAQQKKSRGNFTAHKRDNFYFARGLFVCPECGHAMLAYKSLGLYMCLAYKNDNKDIKKCHYNKTININVLDSLLWDAAVSEYIAEHAKSRETTLQEYQEKIEELRTILDNIPERLDKIQQKKKRLGLIWADSLLSDEEYHVRIERVDLELSQVNDERLIAEQRIENLERSISEEDSVSLVDTLRNMSENLFSMSDLQEMCEMVHRYIKCVEMQENASKGPKTKLIRIICWSGAEYWYMSRYSPNKKEHFYWRKVDGVVGALDWIEFKPDIEIVRLLGKNLDKTKKQVSIRRNNL